MLNKAQIQLAGRRWGAVCAANGWRMERGRLCGRDSETRSDWHREVFALAAQHAGSEHREITPDNLRRACIAKVSGHFKSTYDLTNAQLDALLNLYTVLIEPTDLDAGQRLVNPDIGRRDRYLHVLRRCVKGRAYVDAICRNTHDGRTDWDAP